MSRHSRQRRRRWRHDPDRLIPQEDRIRRLYLRDIISAQEFERRIWVVLRGKRSEEYGGSDRS